MKIMIITTINTKYNTINTIQNMLYYTRTELSEGIDVNYTSVSKKRIICHYLYFIDKGFSIQLAVCNGCHDIRMISIDLNSILIINRIDCCCIINIITKSEVIKLLENDFLSKIADHYKI